jgi:hypothetical protein
MEKLPGMRCIAKTKTFNRSLDLGASFPCGGCLPCKITKRQEWTARLLLEMKLSLFTYFVTLTYSDPDLPPRASLLKKDCQLWLKRLRKNTTLKLRYFLIGEYGEKKNRPHYHVLIFTDREMFLEITRDNKGRDHITGSPFHDAWYANSIVDVVPLVGQKASAKVAGYVAGYVLKKITKENCLPGLAPEFTLSSRKPGIGHAYIDILADMLKKKKIGLPGNPDVKFTKDIHMITIDGKKYPIGRYMREKLIERLGGDGRSKLSKETTAHHRYIEELEAQDELERIEEESSARARKAFNSYLKSRKLD